MIGKNAKIIAFPARHRFGHAARVASQLVKARTNREADHVLSRAISTMVRQMRAAGLGEAEIAANRRGYLIAISVECGRQESRWYPEIPALNGNNPKGAA